MIRGVRWIRVVSVAALGILLFGSSTRADELVKAFAFGSRDLSGCQSLTDPSTDYTMVLQTSGGAPTIEYDAGRGWGYEAVHDFQNLPYGDRVGFGIFGPFDESPNSRSAFPDNSCPVELFDSFIGAKNFLTPCDESVAGDRDTPCSPGEGIIFRVDVPNGTYRFVVAVGDSQNPHAHRILAENGGGGQPASIGPNHVSLVTNFNQADYPDGTFAWVGFGDFDQPPVLNGPAFVNMGADGLPASGNDPADCPTLEVTEGYIRIHQLQGNSNPGEQPPDPNGGDLVILEVWNVAPPGPDLTPPEVSTVSPVPGLLLRRLTSITVTFNEEVTGVNASDLRINGTPAATVTGSGKGPYTFTFVEPSPGTVTITWAATHGITDTAETPNPYAGDDTWSYTLDPNAPAADIVINELMAANGTDFRDEDGDSPDWLEIWNRGADTVSLAGWSLKSGVLPLGPTDPPLTVWIFPNVTIGPQEHRVVFASGKNKRPTSGANLHTNFQLNRGGEYLGLYDAENIVVHEYAPAYPDQARNYSYGLDAAGDPTYFFVATPGTLNSDETALGFVEEPTFIPEHGVYDAGLNVEIVMPESDPSITIFYRRDAENRPVTEANGTEYTGPIAISGANSRPVVNIRAVAVRPGYIPSEMVVSSYIFRNNVIRQPQSPQGGFPSQWINPSRTISADYEMDPDIINNASWRTMALEALREVPSVMITMDIDDLFGSGGLYVNANQDCPDGSGASCTWERPCSLEIIYPDGRKGVNVNCGLRMQGGSSRHSVWKVPKLSFRTVFRDNYGPTRLRFPLFPDSRVMSFDSLILDAKLNQVWYHSSSSQHNHVQYVREIVCDDWANMLGSYAAHNIFANLYVNGLHWGLYDIHERCDHDFAASYLGGNGDDYDCLKHRPSTIVNPDPPDQGRASTNWNSMRGIIDDATSIAELVDFSTRFDIDDFCDYMIMNLYAGNSDWPHHNWYATHHIEDRIWRFHAWDTEHVLKIHEWNDVFYEDKSGEPKYILEDLRSNAEFRLIFADHVHRHFFNDGVLYVDPANPDWDPGHPERNRPLEQYMKRIEEIDKIIVLESARWGDYRLNPPGDRNDWLAELNGLIDDYFPRRSDYMIDWFRSRNLYPDIGAPIFSQHGGPISPPFSLTMTRPAGTSGTIYYTMDGSDPREPLTGNVGGEATGYTTPVTLNGSLTVKARIRSGTTWSALTEAFFKAPTPYDGLRITEVMYHPPPNGPIDGDEYEFIELKNTGPDVLDMTNVAFTEGINFVFAEGTIMLPGQFVVLVTNQDAFNERYSDVTAPVFTYGGRLDNDRDTVDLRRQDGEILVSFKYGDGGWWPREADGEGRSLVPVNPSGADDLDDPASWTASTMPLGSPGTDDGASVPTPPRFVTHPSDVMVREGEEATFSCYATGFPDPTYQWLKDGVDIPGATSSSYTTPATTLIDSGDRYQCRASNSEGSTLSMEATLTVTEEPFIRGDMNADGTVDISDAVAILRHLFVTGLTTTCEDAADANDDGTVDIADSVYLLSYLFNGGQRPPAPFPSCGFDGTGDLLRCTGFQACK